MEEHAVIKLRAEAERQAGEQRLLASQLPTSAVHLKMLAEALAREDKVEMVQEVERMTRELVEMQRALESHGQALMRVVDGYQGPPNGDEDHDKDEDEEVDPEEVRTTDWHGLITAGMAAAESQQSSNDDQRHEWLISLRRAIWEVKHPGEPMPGEEDEDLVQLTQQLLKNSKCPISMRDVTDLDDPVCGAECRHVFSEASIIALIRQSRPSRRNVDMQFSIQCPVAGCQSRIRADQLVNDSTLQMALAETRSRQATATGTAGGQGSIPGEEVEDL